MHGFQCEILQSRPRLILYQGVLAILRGDLRKRDRISRSYPVHEVCVNRIAEIIFTLLGFKRRCAAAISGANVSRLPVIEAAEFPPPLAEYRHNSPGNVGVARL